MRLLAFSDLHTDLDRAARLVEGSREVDAVVGVGDFASQHAGLEDTIDALSAIEAPTVLVPGNNETLEALAEAAEGWDAAHVAHGSAVDVAGVTVFGLGGGVPTTPWSWSYDMTEEEARAMLEAMPGGCVLATHSPPRGHVDGSGTLGSLAVLEAIEARRPTLVLCGHIHECWGQESRAGEIPVVNLGPDGRVFEL